MKWEFDLDYNLLDVLFLPNTKPISTAINKQVTNVPKFKAII